MAPTQSPHFATVSSELQLGGTVYAYADIDGDAERATDFLLTLLRDMPELMPQPPGSRLSASSIVRVLGLDSVKAVGLSSYERNGVYHNRAFIHHDGPREGVLRLFGGEPSTFGILDAAPGDADLVWEQQLDIGALLDVVVALSELGVGPSPEALQESLGERVLDLSITFGQLFDRLQATAAVVLSVDESRNLWIPGESFTFPYTDFLLRIEGVEQLADAVIRRAASDPFIKLERSEDWVTVRLAVRLPPPWNAYEPAVMKEVATGRLYVVSSPAFLKTCIGTTEGLAKAEQFKSAMEGLPQQGNGLMYLSAKMTRQMHAVLDQVVAAQGSSPATTVARFLLPDVGYPVGWVVQNKANGILFASNTPSSHKSTLLTLSFAAVLPAAAIVGVSVLEPAPTEDEAFEPPF